MDQIIKEAVRVLEIEAKAVLDLSKSISQNFVSAVETLYEAKGKVIVSGIGKSGHIGRKIASTLNSTGTPAVFLHPAESFHGDLGVISSGDVAMLLSYSGETSELRGVTSYCKRKGIPIVGVSGSVTSTLAQLCDVHLCVEVKQEACPLGLAPTASSTATLAMGDALAMSLLVRRGFRPEDFAEFHPGGKLGARLLTRVKDVMHSGDDLPLVGMDSLVRDAISVMTSKEVRGVVGVTDSQERLVGVVTDGDIRRCLQRSENPLQEKVASLMSSKPKTIDQNEMAETALFLMEEYSIQVLFVVDSMGQDSRKPLGILHLQDLIKAKVR
ncbi:MAG: D-arabinose 5-phosphate isomerase [Bdellovibrionales bacterium CG10_big_fil_rev_8_21_14_0_10_45_34]|nr:MAG: D-arabinose 5-phosphate isomerase [Bdellovibrionales bacterium CG10_big_fil_rev_8_21_14_0_10_45_34]